LIWPSIAALLLSSAAIMGSPGPSTISAVAMGAAFGLRGALNYVCGLIVGTLGVLLVVAAGVVALAVSVPYGAKALGWLAGAYCLFLAFKIATAPPLKSGGRTLAAPAFAGGFLLAIVNPKAYLAIGAVFASVTVASDRGLDALVKTVVLAVMIVIIHAVWLLAGASLSRLLHDPVSSRLINVALAAALAAAVVATLLT
jgi:threonine/homoserine/homoserine lactone efflux protein